MSSRNCLPGSLRLARRFGSFGQQKSPLPVFLWRRAFLSLPWFYFVGRWKRIKTRLQIGGKPGAAGLRLLVADFWRYAVCAVFPSAWFLSRWFTLRRARVLPLCSRTQKTPPNGGSISAGPQSYAGRLHADAHPTTWRDSLLVPCQHSPFSTLTLPGDRREGKPKKPMDSIGKTQGQFRLTWKRRRADGPPR